MVVFIHGRLGGGQRTWRQFPDLVRKDADLDVDVRVVDDPLGQRLRQGRFQLSVPGAADRLATELESDDHTSIVLIGHSLGGTVCLEAVRRMDQNWRRSECAFPVRGIFLLATPRFGWISGGGSRHRGAASNSGARQRLTGYIEQNFVVDLSEPVEAPRRRLPVFAAVASGDRCIGQLGASLHLPPTQMRVFRASHFSIAKPSDRTDPVYRWFGNRLPTLLA